MYEQYKLYFSGNPGSINASLYLGTNMLGSIVGLKDAKAAKKWGKAEAGLHKEANKADDLHEQNVTISGQSHFTV